MNNFCDPLCYGCIYSIATPLLFKDCEKCKKMLKECPDKPGYVYFANEENENFKTRIEKREESKISDPEDRKTKNVCYNVGARVFACEKCGYGIDDIFIKDENNYPIVPLYCPNCGRVVVE